MESHPPRAGAAPRRRANAHIDRTAYSVQDRRTNARVLLESEQRRAQLCPLGPQDIAQRLHQVRAVRTTVLDDTGAPLAHSRKGTAGSQASRRGRRGDSAGASHGSTTPLSEKGGAGPSGEAGDEAAAAAALPRTYEEWLEAGCPTGQWSVLLADGLYKEEEAERQLLKMKYSERGTFTPPWLTRDGEGEAQ